MNDALLKWVDGQKEWIKTTKLHIEGLELTAKYNHEEADILEKMAECIETQIIHLKEGVEYAENEIKKVLDEIT